MRNKRLLLFLLLAVLIYLLNQRFGYSDMFSNPDYWQNAMAQIENNYTLAAILYIIATIIGCVILVLPGITFAVIAALLFGPWAGTILCLIATTLGALFSFWISRYFLRDSLKPLVMKNRRLNQLLFQQKVTHEIILLMITRLLPIFPYNIQNFAYGITDISVLKYTTCTFIFMLPGVALFTFTTAGILNGVNGIHYYIVTVLSLLLLLTAGRLLLKRYKTSNKDVK